MLITVNEVKDVKGAYVYGSQCIYVRFNCQKEVGLYC